MSKITVTIDPYLYRIFSGESYIPLTASEIRNNYLINLKIPIESNKAYQYLYRQLVKLCNDGLIKKIARANTRRSLFVPTELFFKTTFTQIESSKSNLKTPSINKGFVEFLEEDFSAYQADFQICTAEYQEYERLKMFIPSLRLQLKEQSQNTMQRSHQLLGKMNAVKNVLDCYRGIFVKAV